MKTKFYLFLMALTGLVFTSCSKDDDAPVVVGKEMQIDASNYANWTYINLKTGETQTLRDFSAWNYIDMNTGKIVSTTPAQGSPSEIKIDWHIAIHYYDIRTNGGSALMTEETNLEKEISIPTSGFTADKEVENKIYTDMKGMMQSKIGFASKATVNPVLSGWITSKGMPPTFTFTKKVYVARFKDGSYAKLLFTNNTGKGGEKRHVQFAYKYFGK